MVRSQICDDLTGTSIEVTWVFIEVTWVEGHVTELDISNGISIEGLKKYNEASDANATLGLTQHDNMLHDIAS